MWNTVGLSSRTAVRSSGALSTNAAARLRSRALTGFPSSITSVPTTIQGVGFQLRYFVGSRVRLAAEASKLATRGTRTQTAATQTESTDSAGTKKAVTQKKATSQTRTTSKTAGGQAASETAKTVKSAGKKAASKTEKKTLTPEQELKKKIRELKKKALISEEPPRLSHSSWSVFLAEQKQKGESGVGGSMDFGDLARGFSLDYKELPQAELERLIAKAARNQETNKKVYQAWVASKTPAEINEANKARKALARLTESRRRLIDDDRSPKRPARVFALYFRSKLQSETLDTNTDIAKFMKQCGQEWKTLTDAEKAPFFKELEIWNAQSAAH